MLFMKTGEELITDLVLEVIGVIEGQPSYSKEQILAIKHEILSRMHPDEDYLDGPV